MGHELTKEGLKPDGRKISAIVEMPPPKDRAGVLRLVGMATYLAKFVPKFSEVLTLIRSLLAGDAEFRWDEYIHGRAFIQLKQIC